MCTGCKGGKMAKRVDHIGILVGKIDEAIALYQDCFGLHGMVDYLLLQKRLVHVSYWDYLTFFYLFLLMEELAMPS